MKIMKLKHILKYFDALTSIVLWQGDVKINPKKGDPNNWEEIFSGSVIDIPWIYLNYYLVNDINGEAISCFLDKDKNQACFTICLCESKDAAIKYAKGEL